MSTEGAGGAEASIAEGRGRGYRAFKIKVGLHGERDDVRTVERVRAAAGPDAFLWVDANQAYTTDTALRVARELEHLGVAAFEQPLPANDIDGLRRVRERSPIPVALDESLRHPTDLATFVKLGAIDIAIAKVQRNAGLGNLLKVSMLRLLFRCDPATRTFLSVPASESRLTTSGCVHTATRTEPMKM